MTVIYIYFRPYDKNVCRILGPTIMKSISTKGKCWVLPDWLKKTVVPLSEILKG